MYSSFPNISISRIYCNQRNCFLNPFKGNDHSCNESKNVGFGRVRPREESQIVLSHGGWLNFLGKHVGSKWFRWQTSTVYNYCANSTWRHKRLCISYATSAAAAQIEKPTCCAAGHHDGEIAYLGLWRLSLLTWRVSHQVVLVSPSESFVVTLCL